MSCQEGERCNSSVSAEAKHRSDRQYYSRAYHTSVNFKPDLFWISGTESISMKPLEVFRSSETKYSIVTPWRSNPPPLNGAAVMTKYRRFHVLNIPLGARLLSQPQQTSSRSLDLAAVAAVAKGDIVWPSGVDGYAADHSSPSSSPS